MVLNEAFSRSDARAARSTSGPHDLDIVRDEHGRVARRAAKADGPPVDVRGLDDDVQVEEQRRRPAGPDREVRRRHRAPVRDVRLAARADARVERRRRRGRAPLPAPRVELRRQARRGDPRRRRRAAAPIGEPPRRCAARCTACCARSSYDYERMQYNTVVSGAMKLLNALEALQGRRRRRRSSARGLRHPAARALPGLPAHHLGAVARAGLRRPIGDLLDAPWPQVDEAALVQDEIELVLQVNGKLRGSIQRAGRAPTRRRSKRPRSPARTSASSRRAWRPKKVIVVAGPARQRRRRMKRRRALGSRSALRCARSPAAASSCAARRSCAFADHRAGRLRAALAAGRGAAHAASPPARRRAWSTRAPQAAGGARGAGRRAREERGRQHRRRPGARTAAALALPLPPAHAAAAAS